MQAFIAWPDVGMSAGWGAEEGLFGRAQINIDLVEANALWFLMEMFQYIGNINTEHPNTK